MLAYDLPSRFAGLVFTQQLCHPDQGLQPAWRDLLFAPSILPREQQVHRLRARPDSQKMRVG